MTALSAARNTGWQVCIDRGGTFVDVVARAPDGRLLALKRLAVTRDDSGPRDATVAALIELCAALPDGERMEELRLGTTLVTNALLERRGAEVLLLVTRGFADLLAIGDQTRPELFALEIPGRRPLAAAVAEIDERVLADGRVERVPDAQQIARAVAGHTHVAVLFVHAWRHPDHELLAERVARAAGVQHVTLSHRIVPEPGLLARGETTLADAVLTPLLSTHLAQVTVAAGTARVLFMQSSGGLTGAAQASGRNAVLSGPAGGVLAVAAIAADVAHELGARGAIGLDMGGTSTDVCRVVNGVPERVLQTEVGGVRVRAPALSLVTVAAGGGSVLTAVDGRFRVGPQSAGADPGPACHGRGGPPTITDANLVAGRLSPQHFPHLALDVAAARAALAPFGVPEDVAPGFLAIADENMAAAITALSVARGHDVRDDLLVVFGGAGGLHACALAERLGMAAIVVHPLAGVLSAWGLGLAHVSRHAVAAVLDPDTTMPDFPDRAVLAELAAQGHERVTLLRHVDLRYRGAEHVLSLPWNGRRADVEAAFEAAHQTSFGFVPEDSPIELLAARSEGVVALPVPSTTREPEVPHAASPEAPQPPDPESDRQAATPTYRRSALAPGARLSGPALVVEDHATTWVAAGWDARVDGARRLILERDAHAAPRVAPAADLRRARADDPVGLELMSNRFGALAAQMGEHLRRVARSTNIKERLDFSCAVFDVQGGLIANAPHIPVHLGAMGATLRALLDERELRDGDVWVCNDPSRGGSHLPDITVMTPCFRGGRLAFLLANRGHHADVGGATPGSMPADSRSLAEEGAVLANLLAARDGRLNLDVIAERLAAAGTRGLPERLADLRAQAACNAFGARHLHALCDELGTDTVATWAARLADHAAAVMEDVLLALCDGRAEQRFAAEDRLDDGSRLAVAITVRRHGEHGRPQATIDFSGTAPRHPGNRNAPRAVVAAAVLYVFRCLAARPIPLNAGCWRPLRVQIPAGSLLDPPPDAAVCGGNVETSQRLVDLLLSALGAQAASQGTMNNLCFGDADFAHYETLCGGTGAGPGFHGADAVHSHMTNTRLTDVETLELRCPVVVEEFSIRRGSGGGGHWHGGDGVVRRLRFLRPLSVSLLAESRRRGRPGLAGGAAGAAGIDRLSADGVELRTPGGGGYGAPREAGSPAPLSARPASPGGDTPAPEA